LLHFWHFGNSIARVLLRAGHPIHNPPYTTSFFKATENRAPSGAGAIFAAWMKVVVSQAADVRVA
jgi:hypothetical protein